jgi:CheY-like chemotaxis protein
MKTLLNVLESIRKNEETKDLPVTVISNFNQQKDRERAATMGAGFFVKALVNPDDILQQVEKMLLGKHI